MVFRITILVLVLGSFTTCRSVKETKALQDCTFTLSSISDVTVNGVSLQGKQSMRDLQLQESSRISQAIMARKIPIHLTAHIQVYNPNNQKAAINKLDWKLLLRNANVAQGSLNERYEILPKQTVTIPIDISTDIGSVMSAFSVKELTTMMFNMSSVQALSKEIELQVRPSLRVGRMNVKSPAYVTVDVLK